MTQDEAAELLQKYLAGKADQRETSQVEAWYGALPVIDPLPADRKKMIAENIRAHIKDAMGERAVKTHFLARPWVKIAAVLVVLYSFGLIFSKMNKSGTGSNIECTVYTNSHQRKKVTLSDGTTVLMEPSSKMVYPARFASASRVVKLISGDVFFSVAHETRRPFCVDLKSHIQVRVLGTSFRIHDILKDDLLKVTVATGKVSVQKGTSMLGTLIKGQELRFHKKTKQSSVSAAMHPKIVELSFEGSSLAQVIQKMEYVYSIQIQVSNPELLQLKCRAAFNSGQQPAEILDVLCSLHHLRFSQDKEHKSFNIYP